MTQTAKAPVRCGLSGTALKYIACITMLIDHIGASCIEAGILLPTLAAGAASCGGIPVSTLLAADRVLRYIGRLAFPIFCFLAVEGFPHTVRPAAPERLLDAGAGRAGYGRAQAL